MIAQDYKAPESVGRLQRAGLFVGLIGLVLGANAFLLLVPPP